MPESAVASNSRFYRRLAAGVQRARLVEPILACRPPLVVIGAPSGYGKTVLAAQVAASRPTEEVVWIDCGGGGSLDDDLTRLTDLLSSSQTPDQSLGSVSDNCSRTLSEIPDGPSLLLVFDDAGWAADAASLALLGSTLVEAPLGTVTIVTARAVGNLSAMAMQVWLLGVDELRLSDSETEEAWHRLTGVLPDERAMLNLVQSSGRHFALLSLLGRNASLMGATTVPERCSPSVSTLLERLVEEQLSGEETELLHIAAVLGEGALSELADLAARPDARPLLTRVSEVIPLVSVSDEVSRDRFAVHDLVAEALHSSQALARLRPRLLSEAIATLEAQGKLSRAVEAAVRSRVRGTLADCIERTGSRLLSGSGWRSVCAATDLLPSAVIASRPALLLVKAESEWAQGRRAEGIRQAELAIRIEELTGTGVALPHAHAVLAGMRTVLADYSGIVSDVGPLLEDDAVRASEDYGELLYAAIAAFGMLGDRPGLTRVVDGVSAMPGHSNSSPLLLSRIDAARASVVDLLDGDPRTATMLMRRAISRDGVPSHWKVGASCNVAALALESGDLSGAAEDLAAAMTPVGDLGAPSDHAIRRLLSETMGGLSGESCDIVGAVENLLDCLSAEGERFTYVFTCIRGVEVAVALREHAYARDLGERGAALALETGSPVLLWLAELVQAQAWLAVGDVERAGETAERLLPRVEAIGAMGHVLHARLILAEIELRNGDLAAALQHIAAVSEHVVDATPGMVVASYVRSFPDLFGPLAHVIGVERMPRGVFRCLAGKYGDEALAAAASVLTRGELNALTNRMQTGSGRVESTAGGPAGDRDPIVEVRLFGGLEVKTSRGVVAQREWGKRKARLLFAMLVARHGTDVHRAELIDYLWPDLDEAHGVNNFYVVWSAMKRAVAPGSSDDDASRPFENHNGVCRIVSGRVVSDLDLFMKARDEARRANAAHDTAAEVIALRTSIDLYRGDVLPGDIYDDWFGGIRQRFRQEYQASVIRFATIMIEQGDPLAAMPFVIEASERDPLREDLYQARIKVEVASNQRGAAMETYMSCRNTLVEELGIDPSRETVELYQQILAMEDGPESLES